MLKISKTQMHRMIINRRELLIKDIEDHLNEYFPKFKSVYPRGYLLWLINDSINIANSFRIDDIFSMRLFVSLRWEIAPGFYKQPAIAAVLKQANLSAEVRFAHLTEEYFAQAWEEAEQFDDPSEWGRERYFGEKL